MFLAVIFVIDIILFVLYVRRNILRIGTFFALEHSSHWYHDFYLLYFLIIIYYFSYHYLLLFYHYFLLLFSLLTTPLIITYSSSCHSLLGGAQHDTVAAVTHILFTITNPITSLTSIESQLWLPDSKSSNLENNEGNSKFIASRFSSNIANIRNGNQNTDFARSAGRNLLVGYGPNLLSSTANKLIKNSNETNSVLDAHPHTSSSSLAGNNNK